MNKLLDLMEIPVGERHSRLTTYATNLFNKGIEGDALVDAVVRRNLVLSTPLSDEKINKICVSVDPSISWIGGRK